MNASLRPPAPSASRRRNTPLTNAPRFRGAARSIGWTTNDFQYEVGFADLARGLAAIYAVHSATEDAWVAVAIAGGVFMALAGLNHVKGMVRDGNFAPGNSLILLADFGPPIVALVTLRSIGAF